MKQIQLKIYPNGKIEAETIGVKGKKCLKYIPEIEKITNAIVIDSDFTKEYYESENNQIIAEYEEVNNE